MTIFSIRSDWYLYIRRFVVPNVFFHAKCVCIVANRYDVKSKKVFVAKGSPILAFTMSYIVEGFNLSRVSNKIIDLERFKARYENHRIIYRSIKIPSHKVKGLVGKGVKLFEKEPFTIETFDYYFIKTFYSLCQILGEDAEQRM